MVKQEVSGLKILILLSGGAQIRRHISKRSDCEKNQQVI